MAWYSRFESTQYRKLDSQVNPAVNWDQDMFGKHNIYYINHGESIGLEILEKLHTSNNTIFIIITYIQEHHKPNNTIYPIIPYNQYA